MSHGECFHAQLRPSLLQQNYTENMLIVIKMTVRYQQHPVHPFMTVPIMRYVTKRK